MAARLPIEVSDMVDDEYRRGPPEDHEWPRFWRMKKEWDDSRDAILSALGLINALILIRKAAPYAVIIGLIALGTLNSESLKGLLP